MLHGAATVYSRKGAPRLHKRSAYRSKMNEWAILMGMLIPNMRIWGLNRVVGVQ